MVVLKRRVDMKMTMQLHRRFAVSMLMLMMYIVPVEVVVLDRLMRMCMAMSLGQV